jgi:GGDEF domain-containing protein
MTLLAVLMVLILRRLTQSLRDRGLLEERATHLAYHDALTGLPNRTFFNEAVERALAEGANQEVALLLIDLDGFKQVNDTLGHLAGDELIRQFGGRLVKALGPDGSSLGSAATSSRSFCKALVPPPRSTDATGFCPCSTNRSS